MNTKARSYEILQLLKLYSPDNVQSQEDAVIHEDVQSWRYWVMKLSSHCSMWALSSENLVNVINRSQTWRHVVSDRLNDRTCPRSVGVCVCVCGGGVIRQKEQRVSVCVCVKSWINQSHAPTNPPLPPPHTHTHPRVIKRYPQNDIKQYPVSDVTNYHVCIGWVGLVAWGTLGWLVAWGRVGRWHSPNVWGEIGMTVFRCLSPAVTSRTTKDIRFVIKLKILCFINQRRTRT